MAPKSLNHNPTNLKNGLSRFLDLNYLIKVDSETI